MIPYLLSTLRIALPYALAASAGLLCQRAGIENLALEGLMLASAFLATVVVLSTHSLFATIVLVLVGTVVLSVLFAHSSEKWTGEPILLGISFNLLVAGVSRFALKAMYDSASNSPAITLDLSTNIVGFALVAGTYIWLQRSVYSRRVLAAGSAPIALQGQGLNPLHYRYLAFALAGVLLAWAGLDLVFGQQRFSDGMIAGRGYIAVAAVVFGRKKLLPTLAICVVFAAAEALQIRMQNQASDGFSLPTQLVQSLPYLLCMLALVVRRRHISGNT